ncbi:MAG: hypothetical protein ACYCQJ_04415 [Nitrososphaerales archaeon]
MSRKKVRDIYGNLTQEDDEPSSNNENTTPDATGSSETYPEDSQSEGQVQLEWKDYIALMIASLETFLLPIIIVLVVLVLLAVLFTHF